MWGDCEEGNCNPHESFFQKRKETINDIVIVKPPYIILIICVQERWMWAERPTVNKVMTSNFTCLAKQELSGDMFAAPQG